MKLKTAGVLLSVVLAITLSNVRHTAAAGSLEIAKEKVSGYVQEALVNRMDLEASAFDSHEKSKEVDESVYELKLDFSEIDEYIEKPSNYTFIDISRGIFSKLEPRAKRELDDITLKESRRGIEAERLFFSSFADDNMTAEKYDRLIQTTFREEIERQNSTTRGYTSSTPVYQGNQNSLFAALCEIMPVALAITTVGCAVTAGVSINIPIFGQAIAAAAILLLAAVYMIQWYIVGPIISKIIQMVFSFIGKALSAITNWFNQIISKAWDKIRTDVFNELKAEFGYLLKWKKSELETALNLALWLHGVKADINKLKQNKERIHVYLGRYSATEYDYTDYASGDTNGVAFSMPKSDWDRYAKKFNMWYLNRFFLSIMIANGCDFKLCSPTKPYFNISTGRITNGPDGKPISYGQELQYIYGRGFRWPGHDIPIMTADR